LYDITVLLSLKFE